MTPVTSVPRRMRSVDAPSAASSVHASRQGPVGSPYEGGEVIEDPSAVEAGRLGEPNAAEQFRPAQLMLGDVESEAQP